MLTMFGCSVSLKGGRLTGIVLSNLGLCVVNPQTLNLASTIIQQRKTTRVCMHSLWFKRPDISLLSQTGKQTANQKSSWQRANFPCYFSSPHFLTYPSTEHQHSHPNTPPHKCYSGGRRQRDSVHCCCLATAQLYSFTQAAVLISQIATLGSTHTAVCWK